MEGSWLQIANGKWANAGALQGNDNVAKGVTHTADMMTTICGEHDGKPLVIVL